MRPAVLLAPLVAAPLVACQVLGGIGGKILVDSDVTAGDAGDAGALDAPGEVSAPPGDCHALDPAYDTALWPVPVDGPDGTNYAVDAANGTALDHTTQLMWQTATSSATFDDAKCACHELTAGGFTDWRLPSALELVTLVDYAKNTDPTGTGTTVAAINTTVFSDTRLGSYWTATLQGQGALSKGLPFLVDFDRGGTSDATATGAFKGPFRCVRSAAPRPATPRFTAGAESVVDTFTSLEWQRYVTSAQQTPAAAAGYCKQINLRGLSDWRLPTVKELASLVDPAKYPSIDATAFPQTPSMQFVTATRVGSDPTNTVWTVDFGGLALIESPNDASFYVRCVRTH